MDHRAYIFTSQKSMNLWARLPIMSFIFINLASCASGGKLSALDDSSGIAVKAGHGVWVSQTHSDAPPVFKDEGQPFFVSREKPTIIDAPGRLAALVVPAVSNTEALELELPIQKDWEDRNSQRLANSVLWKVIPDLKRVEELFSSRDYAAALPIVQGLRTKFVYLEYLKWVEASCLWNMGKRASAQILFNQLKESIGQAEVPKYQERKPAQDIPLDPNQKQGSAR